MDFEKTSGPFLPADITNRESAELQDLIRYMKVLFPTLNPAGKRLVKEFLAAIQPCPSETEAQNPCASRQHSLHRL